jgi:hypothetical protein
MTSHTDPTTTQEHKHTVKPARVPEWVRRAQAGQLVRKDMTGTVAA